MKNVDAFEQRIRDLEELVKNQAWRLQQLENAVSDLEETVVILPSFKELEKEST